VCISWKKRYNHRYNQRYSHKYNQRHSQREVGCFVHLLLSTSSYVSCTFMVSNASENSQEFPPIPSRWSAYRMPLMIAELAILWREWMGRSWTIRAKKCIDYRLNWNRRYGFRWRGLTCSGPCPGDLCSSTHTRTYKHTSTRNDKHRTGIHIVAGTDTVRQTGSGRLRGKQTDLTRNFGVKDSYRQSSTVIAIQTVTKT